MNAKVGRPRIPKDKAQAVLYGARVSREDARRIDQALMDSGQTPSEVIKKALHDAARPQWTVSKWKYQDLHDKWVEFRLTIVQESGKRVLICGVGKFSIWRHSRDESKLAIQIEIVRPQGRGMHSITLFLGQPVVNRIERHSDPKIADFRCFARE